MPWEGSLIWLAALAVVSFLVTWVAADKLRMRRTPYVAVLTVVTAAITAGYVAWAGVSVTELLTTHWVWGLSAAPLCGAFLILGMTKLPVTQRLTGSRLGIALLWEAVVYGTTEGVLLSALPVFMTWQMVHSLGWQGTGGVIARWTLPIAASIVIVIVHHLGYWEYRNHLLLPISVGCGLLSVGYLVTARPIAPTLAHVLSHATSLVHGASCRRIRTAPPRSAQDHRQHLAERLHSPAHRTVPAPRRIDHGAGPLHASRPAPRPLPVPAPRPATFTRQPS